MLKWTEAFQTVGKRITLLHAPEYLKVLQNRKSAQEPVPLRRYISICKEHFLTLGSDIKSDIAAGSALD